MKQIEKAHCQQCGSTELEDVGYEVLRETEGYSACCNELVVYPGRDAFNRPTRCNEDTCSHR